MASVGTQILPVDTGHGHEAYDALIQAEKAAHRGLSPTP